MLRVLRVNSVNRKPHPKGLFFSRSKRCRKLDLQTTELTRSTPLCGLCERSFQLLTCS